MPKVKVTHYKQEPAGCALAACATLGNFYNSAINYPGIVKFATKHLGNKIIKEGLSSGEICRLLNLLGFHKVTLVTTDTSLIDYAWMKYGRKRLLECFDQAIQKKKNSVERNYSKHLKTWLEDFNYDNKLIISYDFGKFIRNWLNKEKPLGLAFNWTVFFKFAKYSDYPLVEPDVFNGSNENHAVVAYGYNAHGVNICDSHHKYYKYRRAKYRRGFYKIPWEHLLTVMGSDQDLYLPEEYDLTLCKMDNKE